MPKKLLLHACCAPCISQSLMVLQGKDKWEKVLTVKPDFDITIFFYNPNIHPIDEMQKRLAEVIQLAKIMDNTPVIEGRYNSDKWFDFARDLKDLPERGERCFLCYEMRLDESFRVAKERGFESVATTLTISPHKDAKAINRIGAELSTKYGIEYIVSNFKKDNGYKKSIEYSEKYNLYRQDYCGCVYSKKLEASPAT